LSNIHSKRAPRVKPDRKKNIEGDDQWGLRMNPSTIMRAMHFFTSEKLISLFVVFEILLPCCLTDDSGSGARGGASLAVKETYLERYSLQVCLFQHFAASAFYSNLLYLVR
jgi:hypothetical protein